MKPLQRESGELERTVDADGTLTYATPVATATYRADATATVGGRRCARATRACGGSRLR